MRMYAISCDAMTQTGGCCVVSWLTKAVSRWCDCSVGAFNFSQAALPLLLKSTHLQRPPTLIFTGATASVKASANVASFAIGKHALRALSQSLAKEFGPEGVHVSHAIIDGVIDTPATKGMSVGESTDSKIDPVAVRLASFSCQRQS